MPSRPFGLQSRQESPLGHLPLVPLVQLERMNTNPIARKCPVPQDALAYRAFARVDFADAYAIRIEARGAGTLDLYARTMFGNPPKWVSALTRARHRIVSILGLKTTAELHAGAAIEPSRFGSWQPLGRTANELLFGADDRHLDFRLSVQCIETAGGSDLRVVTVVKLNNVLGRLYLMPVKRFHRVIVPAMMRRAA